MSDTTDDMDCLLGLAESEASSREWEWKSGFHTTKNGTCIRIREMTTEHLRNIIRYFNKRHFFDTSVLGAELKRRAVDTGSNKEYN